MRRAIVDQAKEFKPEIDFWSAHKSVSEQLVDMPIFTNEFKHMFVQVYSQYAKDALRKSPFFNTKSMGKTADKQIDWAHREAIEKDESSQFAITSQARQSIENSMARVSVVCRSGVERKSSDTFQNDLDCMLRNLIRDEISCHALLIFAGKGEDEDISTELKEVRRRLSFWCRRKLQSDWGRQVRREIPILQRMDSVVQKFEPDYKSDEDIADAPNVVQVPPSPVESDDEEEENQKNKGAAKKKSMKKQGGRDIGLKKKKEIKADKRLTKALKTPPTMTILRKCNIQISTLP